MTADCRNGVKAVETRTYIRGAKWCTLLPRKPDTGARFDMLREKGMKYAEVTIGLDEIYALERADVNILHTDITYYRKLD